MTAGHTNADSRVSLVNGEELSALLSDRVSSSMSRTARYLWRQGFIVISMLGPLYKGFEKLQAFVSGDQARFDIQFLMFRMFFVRWLRVQLELGEGKVALSVRIRWLKLRIFRLQVAFSDLVPWQEERNSTKLYILTQILILFGLWWMISVPVAVFFRIVEALFRSWSAILRAALPSVPVLFGILIVIFTTGDAWRLFGNESAYRFIILVSIILLVSIASMVVAVMGVPGGWRNSARFPLESSTELGGFAQRTPARGLTAREIELSPLPGQKAADVSGWRVAFVSQWLVPSVSRWLLRVNIYVLFWFTLIAEVFSVAALVAVAFIGIGVVAVDKVAARDLLNEPVRVLWQFNLSGQTFIITRPLLMLSMILGCLASLTLVSVNLQDPQKRRDSLDSMLKYHRQSLAALACYLTTIADSLTMDQLRALLGGLKPETRKALLKLIQNAFERFDPSLIDLILTIARNGRLVGWASTYGISLLAKIPPDKLRALPSEGVEFVLAAANAAGTQHSEEIQLVRRRRDCTIRNWRRQWTTGKEHRAAPTAAAKDGHGAANG
jgi:hypothetical protein